MRNLLKNLTSVTSMFITAAAITAATSANADVIYDLKSDFSESQNANGTWTYRDGNDTLASAANWNSLGVNAWADGQTAEPAWLQAPTDNFNSFDVGQGDIIIRTADGEVYDCSCSEDFNPTNVIWTSDIDGQVNITGNIWKIRDTIEKTYWKLSLNGQMLVEGSLRSDDGNDSVNPQSFTEDEDLENIQINQGDVLMLAVYNAAGYGDFAAANLTITMPTQEVPEPTALAMISLGSMLMIKRPKK